MVRWPCDLSAAPVLHFLIGLCPPRQVSPDRQNLAGSVCSRWITVGGELCKRGYG